ncbi:MAG: hypothetical protein Q9194_004446 [Teloschistes cf. exilis]
MTIEAFDHEVRHAMFATELFDFSKHGRIKHMTIEYRRMWLMAKVVKPSPDENNIRSVVNTITDTLLGDTTEFDREWWRRAYIECLCDAIAHESIVYSRDIDEIMHPTRNGLSIMDEDLFCAAIAVSDLQTLKRLLNQFKSRPDTRIEFFGYAMTIAAWKGDKETMALRDFVEYLMCLSPSPQVPFFPRDIDLGFESAAMSDHTELLRMLFPHIESTKRKDILDRSLRRAATKGRLSALLLDQNAAPNAQSCYGRPLFFAAKTDHVEVVQLLLEHGADINARGYKHSILTGEARNGETKMVEYPLQRGVDLTAYTNGDTALKSAVQWGHEDTVRLLVRLGVNVNGLRTSGHSPMLKAMLFGQQNIIEVLAELGAQRIDPLQTAYAYEFKQGSYPLKCPVVPWSLWRSPHRK